MAGVVAAFVYDSDPLQTKICHCEDCQRLHGEPGCGVLCFSVSGTRG